MTLGGLALQFAAVACLVSPVSAAAGQAAAPKRPAPQAASGAADAHQRLLEQADADLATGRRAEAAKLYAQAADRFQSVRALLQLARLQGSSGNRGVALETLQTARTIAPNSEEVLSAFAQVSLAAGAVTPAAVVLQSLTRMCPTVAPYHYLLGVSLMLAGDMVAAYESLQRADALEPNKASTLIALGLALNSRKMFDEARPFLVRGLELEPDNIDAVAALAETEEGLGKLDEAEALAGRVLAQQADHANGNLVMGLVLMQRGRYADARDAFAKTAAAQPNLPKAFYQLSLAHARLGDEASADKYQQLYRESQRRMEERVNEIRTQTGMPGKGGMSK